MPWHAEPAASEPAPPASPSGIRLAEPPPEVREALAAYEAGASEVLREVVSEEEAPSAPSSARAVEGGDAPLSFQVYTLADLDALRPDADPAYRVSRLMFEAAPRPPSPWTTVGKRARELALEVLAWGLAFARAPRQRPSAEPLRLRFGVAREAALIAARATDWKRVATLGGLALGATLGMLAIVLTVADLTDDLKPARSEREPDLRGRVASAETASPTTTAQVAATAEAAGKSAQATVPAAPAPAANAPAPASPAAIELDEAAPPPARPAKQVARGARPLPPRKTAPAPAPATRTSLALSGTPIPGSPLAPNAGSAPRARGAAKLSFRDADEVFRP